MNTEIVNKVTKSLTKKRPDIRVGDTVKVHIRIKEGDKERVQLFEGTILAIKGEGPSKTFTVRKISYGIGVEKIFPLYAPTVEKIEIVKRGKVRKSKLYYMKRKIGKKAMRVGGLEDIYLTDEEDQPEATAEAQEEENKETETKEDKKEE